jgi:hypothetical protein
MEACPTQLLFLENLLRAFGASTRLKVNYNKTIMVPLNISEERLEELATIFACQKGSLPFTYLGLPWILQNQVSMISCLFSKKLKGSPALPHSSPKGAN